MSTVHTSELSISVIVPSCTHLKVFPDSSFFKEKRAPTLPTPAEIRAINEASGDFFATNFNRPPPVKIPSLGLLVKYGADISLVEAQTQMMVRERLQGQVPVPEVFGWTEDEGQRFIYMSLIEGDTLMERWGSLNEDERLAVCEDLRNKVQAWRTIEQDTNDHYIGKSPWLWLTQ